MATETESPSKEATTASSRGRGRGGRGVRGGRGRGTGRGAASSLVVKATAMARGGRTGAKRGRGKTFSDSRVHAAYERQRDIRSNYVSVAWALRTALADYAERNIEELMQSPRLFKQLPGYTQVIEELRQNYNKKTAEFAARLKLDLESTEHVYNATRDILKKDLENKCNEMQDDFLDSVENRLRILESLHKKDLPVDIRDDQFEYKVISDQHLDQDFGIYQSYKDGHLVPYPSRVEGTEMWQKARDTEAAVAAAAAAANAPATAPTAVAKTKGRGRGTYKRKPQEQPDDQPTPKRSARNGNGNGTVTRGSRLLDVSLVAPAPSKGLLASAAEAEAEPQRDLSVEDSAPASPEPYTNGDSFSSGLRPDGHLTAREKSPALPRNVGELDEHGVRTYSQRLAMREKGSNSRILAPRAFDFEPWEIGFRDTSNDSHKGHTHLKRGKYLDTPNSNGFHYDHYCNSYDYSLMADEDFDEELVAKHGVHPRYGIFLPESVNEQERPAPCVMPGKPIVFIANPSGRTAHASRSFQNTMVARTIEDAPWRTKVRASLRRFCKLNNVEEEAVAVVDYVPTVDELNKRSLGTTLPSDGSHTEEPLSEDSAEEEIVAEETVKSSDNELSALSLLTFASAYVEAEQRPEVPVSTPKPVRYDAIRDVFTDAKPPATPRQESKSVALNFLAELCNVESRVAGPSHGQYGGSTAPLSSRDGIHRQVRVSDSYATGAGTMIKSEPEPSHTHFDDVSAPPRPDALDAGQAYQLHGHGHGHPANNNHVSSHQSAQEAMGEPDAHYSSLSLPPPPPPPAQTLQHPQHQGSLVQQHYSSVTPAPQISEHPHPTSAQPLPPPPQAQYYYAGYGHPDPREPYPPTRSVDYHYGSRAYGMAAPDTYYHSRPYWSPHAGPPPPSTSSLGPEPAYGNPPAPHGPPPPSSHSFGGAPDTPSQARTPFSSTGNAEPLPPLRPPRSRTHSIADEPSFSYESSMRLVTPGSASAAPTQRPAPSSAYYNAPAPQHRLYHYSYAEPAPLYASMPSDRVLPSPQQPVHGYPASPQPGYGHPALSPVLTNHTIPPGHSGQSPPTTPGALPGSGGPRHRSTHSGSSDPGSSKYRKLQPAPVPAHRTPYANKPELKTIPYDHKDTSGSVAALPSSGPTQIRGWNVNQHRRRERHRSDRGERGDSVTERDDAR